MANPLTPRQITEAFHRVGRFEGLTLDEFAAALPPCPAELRREILTEVRHIIASDTAEGTDPRRIDRHGEAAQIADLLRRRLNAYLRTPMGENDVPLYLQEVRFLELESRRGEILATFGVPTENDAAFFKTLRRLPMRNIDSLRGADVFFKLATILRDRYPDTIADRRLSVLYPASGTHIAPVVTAFRLIDAGSIDAADFLLTDINAETTAGLTRQLMFLLKDGLIHDLTFFPPREFPGEAGVEHRFEFTYRGARVSLTMALNRSGEDFWRPEHARGADLVVLHDTEGAGASLVDRLVRERPEGRTQVVLTEGRERVSGTVTSTPPFAHVELEGQYGHCDGFVKTVAPRGGVEISSCFYRSALVGLNR